ncbi:MAG: DJ-1/PfpI family protein [Rhodospirillales bacterium]|nr:MAG: DJ-1/PfpI family protein [Rhodospirillales bacterium]
MEGSVEDTTRREAAAGLAAVAAVIAGGGVGPALGQPSAPPAPAPAAAPPPAHDMHATPPHWRGTERIAFLIYPGFTALDMVGPHYMLTNLMGATVQIVARDAAPVRSDTGLVLTPDATFETCARDLDILCAPGGTTGTLAAMRDEATLRFLADRGGRAKFVTSVCTGSLLLGAAGLLDGYRATSHWLTKSLLPIFGAIPADGRVVRDRNRITGGGVTAGLDFGLSLVGDLRDRAYAEGVQLLAEYAPEPPFDAGTPARAPAPVRTMMEQMFAEFLVTAEAAGREAFARPRPR